MTVDRCNYFFFRSPFLPSSWYIFVFFPSHSFNSPNYFSSLSIPKQNAPSFSFSEFCSTFFQPCFLLSPRWYLGQSTCFLCCQLHLPRGGCCYRFKRAHTLQCTTSFIKNKPLTLPTPAKAKNSFAALLLLRYLSLLSSCFVDALSSRSWFGRCNNYDNNNNNIHNKKPTRNWFVCYFWLSFLSAFSLE